MIILMPFETATSNGKGSVYFLQARKETPEETLYRICMQARARLSPRERRNADRKVRRIVSRLAVAKTEGEK